MTLFNSIYPNALVCSLSDVYENPDSPSLYCSVSGSVLVYLLTQQSIAWLITNSLMLWTFKDPFHMRSMQNTACNRYLHLSLLGLCTVVPVTPALINFELGGYRAVGFPPFLCTPLQPEVAYYSTVLPISFISALGSSVVSYMLWIIYKHYTSIPENSKHRKGLPRMIHRRMIVVLCVYLIVGAFFQISTIKSSRDVGNLTLSLKNYYFCHKSGDDLEGICEVFKNAAESAIDMGVVIFPYLCIITLPTAHLLQIIKKKVWRKCLQLCGNGKEMPLEQLP